LIGTSRRLLRKGIGMTGFYIAIGVAAFAALGAIFLFSSLARTIFAESFKRPFSVSVIGDREGNGKSVEVEDAQKAKT
jgi:hypothetical protein